MTQVERFILNRPADSDDARALRSDHFQRLASHNKIKLLQCCGQESWNRIRKLRVTKAESVDYSDRVQHQVFWRRATSTRPAMSISTLLDAGHHGSVISTIESDINRYSRRKHDLVSRLVDRGLAAVLVRPEMYHQRRSVAEFLVAAGYRIEYGTPRTVGIEKYLALYAHAIGDPDKEPHVRRRAFGYIHKPLYLWLVTSQEENDASASDALCHRCKGVAGVYDSLTLRGNLVYQEMLAAITHDRGLTVLALDPTQEFKYSGGDYSAPVSNSLLANLAGVHIPNSQEIRKDLKVLLTVEELRAIDARVHR